LIDGRARGNSSLTVSSLRRTMADYTFTTPVVQEAPIGKHRLFYFYKLNKGVSIAKSGATYSKVRFPLDEDIATYDEFYLGGHKHIVDDTTKAALISSGLGITEANFTAV
jgi:hypothetical protein